MEHAPYQLAESLEQALGDPEGPGTVFSHANCLDYDEQEAFPAEICRWLDDWGLADYYVPAEHGGALANYEQILQLMRAVARRDLTVAIGHGKTYLGGVCVWVAGSPAQAAILGCDIRIGDAVSLGLTERAHGSDLLAGEVCGRLEGSHWMVDGEKWLINNATRGQIISLLTRTDPTGGPRGFSILLVDKRHLSTGTYRCLPKVPTHGIRGADISGIAFDGARVPGTSLVGPEGAGIEIVLKALQLTRTMCSALSLGAADHGLDVVLSFAEQRELFGRRLIDLPQARRTLATAAADTLTGEALAIVAGRSLHTLTAELSVTAAVTKYQVPTGTDATLAELAKMLGARAFLKDVHARGMFQKIERDHRIVGLFDGNTLVNLNGLINQFRVLARGWERRDGVADGARQAFDLAEPLPQLDPTRLSLLARHGSTIVSALPGLIDLVREAVDRDAPGLKAALASAERVLAVTEGVHRAMRQQETALTDVAPATFDLAKRYTLCFAAASAIGLWAYNHAAAESGRTGGLWQDALWLRAVLDRVLVRLGEPPSDDPDVYEQLLEQLRGHHEQHLLFSLLPLQLSAGEAR
ncbi:MAG TPA: acyl-CoA dehydrogenase family protein [Jatrophihabitantaceae bacterium]|jgi:alkylation response protein AidB-like acyl-CoA dehydrogenase